MRTALCVAALLCCSLAFAAEPKAVITGKPLGKPGYFVVLNSGQSTPADAKRKWVVWPELPGTRQEVREQVEQLVEELKSLKPGAQVILPADDENEEIQFSIEGNGRLALAGIPGAKYKVVLIVTVPNEEPAIAKHEVAIGTFPGVPPPDTPDPPDDPDPPPPTPGVTNRYDLEQACRLWLVQIPNETLSEKPAMRQVFATIGQGATDGKYATAKDVETGLSKTLKAAGTNKLITTAAWNSWGKSASAAIVALQASGKIATPQDYGQALIEIAEGLK